MDRLKDKVALVTGATSGLGSATARLMAEEGARVIVAGRDEARGEPIARALREAGRQAVFLRHDVASESSWEEVIRQALALWQRLDVLVNNAGVSMARPISETTLDDWRLLMSVNLDGVFLGMKHVLPVMRRGGGGSVVNVSSTSGLTGVPGASAYCASKAGVRLLTKAVALECAQAGDGVRVNVVHPGAVDTPIWEKQHWWPELVAKTGSPEAARERLTATIPMRRMARAEEVAQTILHLASDEASYVTGADWVVDGGYTAQ